MEVLSTADRNPVIELIKIADRTKSLELKAKIWSDIQSYCEAPQKEPAKLPANTPDESLVNAIAAQKMIKALEDDAALNPSPAPAGS